MMWPLKLRTPPVKSRTAVVSAAEKLSPTEKEMKTERKAPRLVMFKATDVSIGSNSARPEPLALVKAAVTEPGPFTCSR